MKTIILIISAITLILVASCKNTQTDERVVYERDSLISIINEKESSVTEFINSFTEVERNLDSVTSKQHIILVNSDKTTDLNSNQKIRINSEIKAINELMNLNTEKLKKLEQKINVTGKQNIHLQKAIVGLNNQLKQKFIELNDLNDRLNSANIEIQLLQIDAENLSNQNMIQADMIDYAINEMHTAYYIVGDSKTLQTCSLIDKTGGLLGIGKTFKLNQNIDNRLFTKIDFTLIKSIPINSKSMKIITTHPINSYTLSKTGELINSIEITNPTKFWSISKYLVITY